MYPVVPRGKHGTAKQMRTALAVCSLPSRVNGALSSASSVPCRSRSISLVDSALRLQERGTDTEPKGWGPGTQGEGGANSMLFDAAASGNAQQVEGRVTLPRQRITTKLFDENKTLL